MGNLIRFRKSYIFEDGAFIERIVVKEGAISE
jgi:hypothetical protein